MQRTLFDKIWNNHLVSPLKNGGNLIYIDRHLIHEVTSAQAFDGLRVANRKVRQPKLTFATMDHNVPTEDRLNIKDPISKAQIEALRKNCAEFGVTLFDLDNESQGIVHIIGPELGITLPGLTIVCGDSHTSTHGAFGTYAMGIGTSEVEHVLATQCLPQSKPKNYKIEFTGTPGPGVTAKDLILKVIGLIGTAGGTGYVFEYCGEAIEALSMEARMTICNMTIEAGARAGLIAPDEVTFEYIRNTNRLYAPQGEALDKAIEFWKTLPSDEGALFDNTLTVDASRIAPQVTWGTSPGMVIDVNLPIPQPEEVPGYSTADAQKALKYMGLEAGKPLTEVKIDTVFIGSCTNARIEDLRNVAAILKGKKVAQTVHALVVPGSQAVRRQCEAEGLDKIFVEAGCDWRESGCSMCLAMNPDQLKPGERCASTSNRNFEGRQGKGGRTHLVSPQMAAAAAVEGRFVDIRTWGKQ